MTDRESLEPLLTRIKSSITNEGLMLPGEPISEEAIESILEAIDCAIKRTQGINKEFTSKKCRKDD